MLHYSGHGALNGYLQIEENVFITPEQLFNLSQRSGIPFVIYLDMCRSHLFGEKYQSLLIENGLSGLVLASNDGVEDRLWSYESKLMDNVRRLNTPFIISDDSSVSRGVFSTAFSLGLLRLRDFDLRSNNNTRISVQMFNDELLIPICNWLSSQYSVPIQRPKVFSS